MTIRANRRYTPFACAAIAVAVVAGTTMVWGQGPARKDIDKLFKDYRDDLEKRRIWREQLQEKLARYKQKRERDLEQKRADVATQTAEVASLRAEITRLEGSLAARREALIDAVARLRVNEARLADLTPKDEDGAKARP